MRVYLFILLGIGVASFIWFLSTPKGRKWRWRYEYRLRSNNNTRALLCWVVTGALFVCLLLACTGERQWPVGIDVSTPHYSKNTQEWLTLYEKKMAEPATIASTAKGVAQGVSAATSQTLHGVHDAICSFLGYTVLFLGIFSALYTVIAFRDEFMGVWEETKDKVFGRRSGEQDLIDVKLPAPPTHAQQQSGSTDPVNAGRKPLSVSNYLTYEFIFALLGELSNMFLHRRRM